MRILILIFVICFSAITQTQAADSVLVQGACVPGIQKLGETNFSILISCEGALGNYAGVYLSGHWADVGSKKWGLGDRYWYDSVWGDNITSFAYDDNTSALYIATSGAYGTAGVYRLNLTTREYSNYTFKELNPNTELEGQFTIINHFNDSLSVEFNEYGEKFTKKINLREWNK